MCEMIIYINVNKYSRSSVIQHADNSTLPITQHPTNIWLDSYLLLNKYNSKSLLYITSLYITCKYTSDNSTFMKNQNITNICCWIRIFYM